ncbi:MAG: hypothetical protein V4558_12540 [Gemmatimonadota bacterium]
MTTRLRPFIAALLLALPACGDGSTGPTDPDGNNPYGLTTTGPGVLSVSPIDTAWVISTTPLGKLGPPGHVLPTDHVYISFVDAYGGNQQNNDCSKRPIYAAGSGVITFVLVTEDRGDTKVDIQMTKTFHYYYDHVLLASGMIPGTHVTAGQQIGTTTGFCPSFDLGAYDYDVTLPGLVNPARYGENTRHAVSPYKYFTEPLRALYYARSRTFDGVPANRDGRIDFGIAGKLVGDWFHSSLPVNAQSAGSPAGWAKSIGFVYDYFSGAPQVSVGGTIAAPFFGNIGVSDPDPATVTPASGVVGYQIRRPGATETYGWMLVQMTAADRIKVEFFLGASSRPADFTAAAQEYLR